MAKFTVLSISGTVPSNCRGGSLPAWLLAIALLLDAAAPAWAIPKDTDGNVSRQEDYAGVIHAIDPFIPSLSKPQPEPEDEVIRAIEAFPDVVVFPIRVAGSVVARAPRNLTNKIAQASGEGNIAVIYPDIGEPYRSVFAQIIAGIEAKAKGRVANFAVGANVDAGELNNSLRRSNTRVVIALGRQGVKAASTLDSNLGMVVGGVLTSTENEASDRQVNSLSPDPALLFSRLKGMMPKVRRVFTVYDPRQNAWMVRLAKEAARAQGLEFTAYEAQDLRSAMRAYQEIFAAADSSQDALWLPQDSTTVEDSTVLPLVLQESWSRNLAVFSSSFGHVRRGVLFSLYPNNVELGRHLAGSALDFLASGASGVSGMVPLREVLMAINLRTAKHLGLNTSRPKSFDMAFPEQ
ncbi:MAG: ABC transporter substrate binding protein [Gallionella sp.]|nr:ABC transporter substrate binding protein [Gallionella sp.]